MHHHSLTYIVEIGTVGIIPFQKNAPNIRSCGAKYWVNFVDVVQISIQYIGEKRKTVRRFRGNINQR